MNLEGKDVLSTFEYCEEVWALRAAELFEVHLNQVLSSCKKSRFVYIKDLNINANILFCNGHKLKQTIF